VVDRPCEARWELVFLWFVCVAPLWLGGLGGKKSTPSIGWEVPVRSQLLATKELELDSRNLEFRSCLMFPCIP
jgi:hypothetical protein